MALDIENQLVEKLKTSNIFALQCDESTDVAQCSQLIVFCRFISETTISEQFLFSKSLETTSKGSDVFTALSEFFDKHELSWKNVLGICTDGAPAMLGSCSGFIALAKNKNPSIIGTHCCIHRQALASKTLPHQLMQDLQLCIRVVNFVKSSALNTRLFGVLCDDLLADHKTLLFHTEVRWLSKGNMLDRLYELKSEVEVFLMAQNKNNLHEEFVKEEFVFSLAYLADFFEALNNLNLKLQGRNTSIITAYDATKAFLEKISLWKRRLNDPKPNFSSFRRLNELIDDKSKDFTNQKKSIIAHLDALSGELRRYFPDVSSESWQCILTTSPFNVEVDLLPSQLQEEVIDLKCNSTAKNKFGTGSLEEFWVEYLPVYPAVSREALNILVQFSSTYLCESGFSRLLNIKTKSRNRLDVQNDLRCALSTIRPNIKKLVSDKKCQRSH